jgi:hypothetical protein
VVSKFKVIGALMQQFWVKWTEWFDLDEPLTEPVDDGSVDDGSVDDPSPLDVEFSEMVKSIFSAIFRVIKRIFSFMRE